MVSISLGLISPNAFEFDTNARLPVVIGEPSTMINGDNPCEKEFVPLIRIRAGAFTCPLLTLTFTPAARPANCLSTEGVTNCANSLTSTLEAEPVKDFFC